MTLLEDFLLPIIICVLLPIAIVWICAAYRRMNVNTKAEVLMKALEKGAPCDVDGFVYDKKAKKMKAEMERSVKNKMNERIQTGFTLLAIGGAFLVWTLLRGADLIFVAAILLLLGLAFTCSGLIGRKMYAEEIAAETKKNVEKIGQDETK